MKAFLLLAVCVVLISSCMSLDCPECRKDLCKEPEKPCRFGSTLDVCACCKVCYKALGEECGGPWDVFGHCANHLTCIKFIGEKNVDPIREFNAVGKCLALPK